MSKTTWAGVTGSAISSFEKLRNLTSLAYNANGWLDWIKALELFVSRGDPKEVIMALEMCRKHQPVQAPVLDRRIEHPPGGLHGWDIPG